MALIFALLRTNFKTLIYLLCSELEQIRHFAQQIGGEVATDLLYLKVEQSSYCNVEISA